MVCLLLMWILCVDLVHMARTLLILLSTGSLLAGRTTVRYASSFLMRPAICPQIRRSSMHVGIHRLTLNQGVTALDFETMMANTVFPAAAETPGSLNRAGRSSILSQHLLRADGEYLWIIKASGVFDEELFRRVFERMKDESLEVIAPLGTHVSSDLFTVVASLEIGPRSLSGEPLEAPKRGTDL
jgi:hypothetical protein